MSKQLLVEDIIEGDETDVMKAIHALYKQGFMEILTRDTQSNKNTRRFRP